MLLPQPYYHSVLLLILLTYAPQHPYRFHQMPLSAAVSNDCFLLWLFQVGVYCLNLSFLLERVQGMMHTGFLLQIFRNLQFQQSMTMPYVFLFQGSIQVFWLCHDILSVQRFPQSVYRISQSWLPVLRMMPCIRQASLDTIHLWFRVSSAISDVTESILSHRSKIHVWCRRRWSAVWFSLKQAYDHSSCGDILLQNRHPLLEYKQHGNHHMTSIGQSYMRPAYPS